MRTAITVNVMLQLAVLMVIAWVFWSFFEKLLLNSPEKSATRRGSGKIGRSAA